MIRSFIALELSEEARTALTDLQTRLKANLPPSMVRWTAVKNMHLTLHFLGDISPADLDKAKAIVTQCAATCPPFALKLGGLGCFPNIRRPRVVWVGVLGETTRLVKLHQTLGEKLQAIGFKPETRPYAPHLTLGRVKKGRTGRQVTRLGQQLIQEQPHVGQLALLQATELSLMQSELKPNGPLYTPLIRGLFDSSA